MCFTLLGSFSYGSGEEDPGGYQTSLRAGRKTLSFLQYLIVHHGRSIPAEELMEEFWPEGEDPASALRRMLFESRNLLKAMFPESGDFLLTHSGSYTWNPGLHFELDTERFEAACLDAAKLPVEERLELLLPACSLYRGDFLPANDSGWAMGLRQYYRALYVDACRAILPLLEKREKWLEVLGVCEQAYRIDFAVEDFTVYAMRALVALGQSEQAIGKYQMFRDKMLKELGLPPGENVERLHLLAQGLRKKDVGIPDVFRLLCREEEEEKAFFCTFEMFRNIVSLERRHLARSNETSALAVVSLGGGADFVTDTRRLERVLLEGLRAGDPVARLEAGAYIFLLTGATAENAQMVIGRLDRIFHKTYWRSKASITSHIAELTTEGEF